MSHPDSNYQIGQMRHQEFEAQIGRYESQTSNVISSRTVLRLATFVGGGFAAVLVVAQLFMI